MHKAKVEGCDPLERVQVQRTLEARNGSDKFLLAEEAHTDIVPQF
jgi:hypothetical protein